MHEITNDRLLFSTLIKIHYDKRFIRTAQNFIEDVSVLAGANKDESLRISLLTEECLAFVIDKYIDRRLAAHIQIGFIVTMDNIIRIEITDIGPPIHESLIPKFDVADEHSKAGLWYKLVRELSDDFVFINQYNAGWLIRIDKKIEKMTFSADGGTGKGQETPVEQEHAEKEKHIRWATVDDVPSLIDLAYMTYRYSYDPAFYNKELLKRKVDEKLYETMLVEYGGKIIGACALKYSDAGRISAEIGSAMVAPEYRGSFAIHFLAEEVNRYVQTNPSNCEFFFGTAVTSHVRSQKAISRIHNGFKPMMLFLNMVPPSNFIGITDKTAGRESLLYVYHLNDKLKAKTLYITAAIHAEIIGELIANTGSAMEVLVEYAEPEDRETQISIKREDSLRLAVISIESLGQDWFAALSRQLFETIISGVESIKVTIPAFRPLPGEMESMLTDLHLLFCGLSLRSLFKVDLAYCLTTKPVHFDLIKMYDPVAQKLLTHIEKGYARVWGKG